MKKFTLIRGLLSLGFFLYRCTSAADKGRRVLIFSKTEGYRHTASIEEGQKAILKMAADNGFMADTSENPEMFNDDSLKHYRAVIFLNISGSVFNNEQRVSLKRFVQAGGGVLSIHASADAERDWPWFGRLIGAYYDSHPPVQKGKLITVDKNHPASSFMPDSVYRTDEFYNFQQVSPDIKVLVNLDEKSYTGGSMGSSHPSVWYQEFEGGRSFYTSWGHTKESWREPLFLQQVRNGLQWVMGGENPKPLDYSKSEPEENRFTEHILMEKMDEPIQMAIAKNGNVYVAQRRGNILLYDAAGKTSRSIGTIPVLSAYEDGLLGMALDPKFNENKFIYVFFAEPAPKDSVSNYHISRFTLNGNGDLDLSSQKVLIKIPHQSADGIHTGGGMLFDPRGNGNLFITIGDNTSPRATLYAPIDERPGREIFDAQRTASNSNDLRGKILRIHPEPDGTYTIPDGNLFPKGTAKTRPEIYSMGHRQPWRLSLDTKTGWLYEGEVGPDASFDSAGRGPMAYDELNQIRKPGNFGWPYFGGNNQPYYEYDFATGISGKPFDPKKPVNHSRLNTGLTDLPPAQGSLIWYANKTPKEFPIMGTGGRAIMGGPFFRKEDYKDSKTAFPDYYDNKWFITEWIRDWIIVVTLDDQGNYRSMERFLPDIPVAGPMDMQFGPDGSLYVLEYGKGWFRQNNDSKLVRIEYNPGNRAPVPVASAGKKNGAVPFSVQLSSNGTKDYDHDNLKYEWKISSAAASTQIFSEADPVVNFDKAGIYTATLTVTDSKGASASQSVEIHAGNDAPEVKIEMTGGNKTFFFPGEKIKYAIRVMDAEDGSLANGKIPTSKVFVNMNYSGEGYKPETNLVSREQRGIALKGGIAVNAHDCYSCHSINLKSVGPAFQEIAERYKGDTSANTRLAKKVISGGAGEWGTVSMSAHPELPLNDAKKLVSFILSLAQAPPPSLPVMGSQVIQSPSFLTAKGVYVLRASYTDKGANGIPPATGESAIVLKAPWILPSQADFRKGSVNIKVPNPRGEIEKMDGTGAYFGYRQIDLSGISQIAITGWGDREGLELRMDSTAGKIIGRTAVSTTRESNAKDSAINIRVEPQKGAHDIYFVLRGKYFSVMNYIRFALKEHP